MMMRRMRKRRPPPTVVPISIGVSRMPEFGVHAAREDEPMGDAWVGGHGLQSLSSVAPVMFEYVFVGHSSHVSSEVAPVAFEYVPAEQLVHCEEPGVAYVPGPHTRQTEDVSAPTSSDDLPDGQSVHALAPEPEEYFPASQDVQLDAEVAPEAAPYLPGEQVMHSETPWRSVYLPGSQNLQADAPIIEYLPALHKAQKDDPTSLANLPPRQDEQVCSRLMRRWPSKTCQPRTPCTRLRPARSSTSLRRTRCTWRTS